MIRHLRFFISEAFIGMRRSGIMIFIAIGTISVSLIVFGLFLLINVNMTNIADFVNSKLEVRVFLKDSLTRGEISKIQEEIRRSQAVDVAEFVDKREAWKLFKQNFESMNLSDYLEDNPLPHSIRVVLNNNHNIAQIAQSISKKTNYVTDVVYGGVIAERMQSFSRIVRIGGISLIVFLTLATLFIIVNTIRLTVINRQGEVTIMKLVGATNPFISGPFIIEGVIMGILGSVISVAILRFGYSFFMVRIQESLPFFPVVFDQAVLNQIYFFVVVLGTFLGAFGAFLSISKSLKSTI